MPNFHPLDKRECPQCKKKCGLHFMKIHEALNLQAHFGDMYRRARYCDKCEIYFIPKHRSITWKQ